MGVSEGSKLTGTKILGRGLTLTYNFQISPLAEAPGEQFSEFSHSRNSRILLLSFRADPGQINWKSG